MKPQDIPSRSHAGHDNRVGRRGEARVPAAVAVVVAAGLYALLPESLLLGPRLLIPLLEVLLLVAVLLARPRRLTSETRWSRLISMGLAVVIAVTNIAALGLLVAQLVKNKDASGGELLLGALQVWATNVIAFALIFWELDRGGPVARTQTDRADLPLADFRFTQVGADGEQIQQRHRRHRALYHTATGLPWTWRKWRSGGGPVQVRRRRQRLVGQGN
jgi:hypothetical protein